MPIFFIMQISQETIPSKSMPPKSKHHWFGCIDREHFDVSWMLKWLNSIWLIPAVWTFPHLSTKNTRNMLDSVASGALRHVFNIHIFVSSYFWILKSISTDKFIGIYNEQIRHTHTHTHQCDSIFKLMPILSSEAIRRFPNFVQMKISVSVCFFVGNSIIFSFNLNHSVRCTT